MRNLIFFLLVALSWGLLAHSGRLRVATWNVHNLFDAIDDGNGDQVPSAEQVDKKLRQLSKALQQMQADVLALQEVEKLSLLQRLAGAGGYRYAILVEGNDDTRGIDVGLLSKVKVVGYATHRNDRLPYVEGASLEARFSRDCLEVHLRTPQPLILLVNHFKSKVGKGKSSDALRRAQAQRVVEILRGLERHYPGHPVVVLGDLNDRLESWPLEPLARSGLMDPFAGMSPAQRYTHRHRGEGVALDHILLSPALGRRLLPGTPTVGQQRIFRRCSDHRPMWLDLQLEP